MRQFFPNQSKHPEKVSRWDALILFKRYRFDKYADIEHENFTMHISELGMRNLAYRVLSKDNEFKKLEPLERQQIVIGLGKDKVKQVLSDYNYKFIDRSGSNSEVRYWFVERYADIKSLAGAYFGKLAKEIETAIKKSAF